jgi:hypothetical protein
MNHNCFYHAAGTPVVFAGKSLQDWQELGRDRDSIVVDPLFVNAKELDFRLRPDSPALKLGFKPFDYTKAGVYGDPDWVKLARDLPVKPLNIAPDPPPLDIIDDFEDTLPGAQPAGAEIHVEKKGDAIGVTDELSPGGNRCVKLQDAPGLTATFNPHLVYRPKHTQGTTRCSFDLRIAAASRIDFEWRDYLVGPYQTGPCFSLRDGKLHLAGQDPMSLPMDTWIHFDTSAGLGDQDTDQWVLAVSIPGQTSKIFDGLPQRSKRFKQLDWIGFISNAQTDTAFYIDNLEIVHAP